jgi:hypothetical protein
MREIRPSGSEGGAGFNPRLLPLSRKPKTAAPRRRMALRISDFAFWI